MKITTNVPVVVTPPLTYNLENLTADEMAFIKWCAMAASASGGSFKYPCNRLENRLKDFNHTDWCEKDVFNNE